MALLERIGDRTYKRTERSYRDLGDAITTLEQLVLNDITASESSPYEIDVSVPDSTNPFEVLKLMPDEELLKIVSRFKPEEADDFLHDGYVIIDGTLRLQTHFEWEMDDEGPLGGGHMWSQEVDLSEFSNIEEVAVISNL